MIMIYCNKDMSSGVIDFSSTRFISFEEHDLLFKRCNPQLGDLLLTKIGTTGVPVIVNTDRPFSIFVSVALIKAPWTHINVEYIHRLISSPFVRKQSDEGRPAGCCAPDQHQHRADPDGRAQLRQEPP